MAAKNSKAISSLVVHVGLDDQQVTKSLSALKQSVRSATSEWKAQFAIFKSQGQNLEAAKAKYDGLSNSIKAQTQLIERQRDELKGLGTRTKENAEQYDKLGTQINKNVQHLGSLTAQQERAKKAMDFETSGIRSNRSELSLLIREMDSSVKMYQAQGREVEANKAKLHGLQSQIGQLNQIRDKEVALLNKVAQESGRDSTEYREQAVRVTELKSKIASTANEYNKLNDAMSKRPHTSLGSILGQIRKVGDQAEKTSGIFSKMLGANLLANGISSAFGRITSGLHEAADAGAEYNKEQQVMSASWTTLTNNAGKGKQLVDMVNNLSNATGQSADLTNELAQGFYHLHSSRPEAENMTKAILNMGDAVGLTGDQVKTVGLDMVHSLSSGKLDLAGLNQMSDYFPMFQEEMAKHYHVTVGTLRKMVTAGKVSAAEVETVFTDLGNVKYGKAAENMLGTMTGMERVIKARIPQLIGSFEKPFMTSQSKLFKGVSEWVSNKHTSTLFSKMGQAASKGVVTITNAFGKVFGAKGISKTADSAIENMTKGITRLSNYIAKHAPQIVDFFKGVKTNAGNSFTILLQVLKDMSKIVAPILGFAVKHPKFFAGVVIGVVAVSKAIRGLNIVLGVMNAVMDANPISLIVIGVAAAAAAIGVAIYEIIKHWKQVKAFFAPAVKWFGKIWKGIAKGISSFGKGVVSFFKKLPSRLWRGFKGMLKLAAWLTPVGAAIMILHSKFGKKLISWMKKLPKRLWNGFQDKVSAIWHGISDFFSSAWGRVSKFGGKIVDFIKGLPHKMAVGIRKGAKEFANAFIHIGNLAIDGVQSIVRGIEKAINWVLRKVGMGKHKLSMWDAPHIPYFANGTVNSMGQFTQNSLVHVGDGNKPELIKHKDGSIEMTPAHDTLTIVQKGDMILGGDKTAKLLPHFAGGSFLGSIGSFISGGFDKLKSVGSDIFGYLTHPAKIMNTLVQHFVGSSLDGMQGSMKDIATGMVKTLVKSATSFITKEADASMPNPTGKGVNQWKPYVIKALKANGLSTSAEMVAKVLRQIATESGGNAGAVQHGYTDVNTLTGNLARGLMQTIPPTFNAYKFSGHGNIMNGYDNLLAALNYAKHRYGKDLSYLGQGHGYANGGKAQGLSLVGEAGKHELIRLSDGSTMLSPNHATLYNFKKPADIVGGNMTEKLMSALHIPAFASGTTALKLRVAKLQEQISKSEGNLPEVVVPLTDRSRAIDLMQQSLNFMASGGSRSSQHQVTNSSDSTVAQLMKQNNDLLQLLVATLQGKQFTVDPKSMGQAVEPFVTQQQNTNLQRNNRAMGVAY